MGKQIVTFNFVLSGNRLAEARKKGFDGYYKPDENITVISIDVHSMREAKSKMQKAGFKINYLGVKQGEEDAE